jgi:hypothetical protein
MKIYELMSMSAPLLRMLNNEGVLLTDVKFIPLMLRYESMKTAIKKTAIKKILSDEFGVSERSVHDIIERLDKDL